MGKLSTNNPEATSEIFCGGILGWIPRRIPDNALGCSDSETKVTNKLCRNSGKKSKETLPVNISGGILTNFWRTLLKSVWRNPCRNCRLKHWWKSWRNLSKQIWGFPGNPAEINTSWRNVLKNNWRNLFKKIDFLKESLEEHLMTEKLFGENAKEYIMFLFLRKLLRASFEKFLKPHRQSFWRNH